MRSDLQPHQSLWAITSYFNPVGYRRRIENYHRFRERLSVPLLAVELAYRPDFELGEGDADILVQLRGTDVMWQKERLLNIALKALPEECTKVAWIDSDILFERDDWPDRAAEALEKASFVHLFSQVHYMPPGAHLDSVSPDIAEARRTSLVSAVVSGASAIECFDQVKSPGLWNYTPGFAWAARLALMERVGFYDCCIVGGGDQAMAAAAYGYYDYLIERHQMIDQAMTRYIAWAEPFHDAVGGAIDFVEGNIFHLWHGTLANRKMTERYRWLRRFEFDPTADIAPADNGMWRWNSHKPDMHAFVRERFVSRREDG